MSQRVELDPEKLRDTVTAATQLSLSDAVFDQVASVINAGKHVVLIGPPGTGKTRLAHAICDFAADNRFSTGTIPTTASADWTTFDTVGGYVPTSTQHLEFRPGIFLRAISTGRWLVVDEINRAEIDKAVSELFTVLSGQQVDLSYKVGGHGVRILPFKQRKTDDWLPELTRPDEYDYVVHPNWRILATMNIYDKASLFNMSFAFMRRFAFIDINIPVEKDFDKLCLRWIKQRQETLPNKFSNIEEYSTARDDLVKRLNLILNRESAVMRCRELGPAIVKDMISYICDRACRQEIPSLPELLAESFLLYAVPQLDGLARESVIPLYCFIKEDLFNNLNNRQLILSRIKSMYPHIQPSDWRDAARQWLENRKINELAE